MALPVLQPEPSRERADAVLNRQRVLDAAERLFRENGVSCTSMEAIAAAAGVGKGTVFRRFGDRASLAYALLNRSGIELQEGFIRGPAPLGPGAPPAERLVAFGHAVLDRLDAQLELYLEAESGRNHLTSAPYAANRAHVRLLVAEACPDADADFLADALLAPLSARVVCDQRIRREMLLDTLKDGYADLVTRLVRR